MASDIVSAGSMGRILTPCTVPERCPFHTPAPPLDIKATRRLSGPLLDLFCSDAVSLVQFLLMM